MSAPREDDYLLVHKILSITVWWIKIWFLKFRLWKSDTGSTFLATRARRAINKHEDQNWVGLWDTNQRDLVGEGWFVCATKFKVVQQDLIFGWRNLFYWQWSVWCLGNLCRRIKSEEPFCPIIFGVHGTHESWKKLQHHRPRQCPQVPKDHISHNLVTHHVVSYRHHWHSYRLPQYLDVAGYITKFRRTWWCELSPHFLFLLPLASLELVV